VLLNLYNNAFYATSEKLKAQSSQLGANNTFQNPRGLHPYVPTVAIVTKKINDRILISVKDNGPGIPQTIIDKIFQPFFTTKPTGEGTGLGLSLSYDIIKAHGGEIKVETNCVEGLPGATSGFAEASADKSARAGSEFVIQLPIV